jgi:hypothetical protein
MGQYLMDIYIYIYVYIYIGYETEIIGPNSIKMYEFSDSTLLHRTDLAEMHPFDKLTHVKDNAAGGKIDILIRMMMIMMMIIVMLLGFRNLIRLYVLCKTHNPNQKGIRVRYAYILLCIYIYMQITDDHEGIQTYIHTCM